MPAARLSRRRKSSHALFTPAKAGIYGVPSLSHTSRPVPVTFAPNVTPITYTEVDPEIDGDPSNPFASLTSSLALLTSDPTSPNTNMKPKPLFDAQALAAFGVQAKLFPPSETPAPPPARKRCPPGKRRSQGYIPRPPNAFMLFRADFVRQKHVPGSIETNHGSLSKIIGTCWRQLPLEEKRVWEVKAKQEKAAHKAMFPDYRFRPVHNKNKHLKDSSSSSSNSSNNNSSHSTSHQNGSGNGGSNSNSSSYNNNNGNQKQPTTAEDERRCDEVAQLLLEGKKGEELARAVRSLDLERERERERERQMQMQEEMDLGFHEDMDGMMDDYELGLDCTDERERDPLSASTSTSSSSHLSDGHQIQLHMPVSQQPFVNHNLGVNNNNNNNNNNFGLGLGLHHPYAHNHPRNPYHRRSSSVPLPNEWLAYTSSLNVNNNGFNGTANTNTNTNIIALPAIPPFMSRPGSPVGSIARFHHHTQQQQFTNPFDQQQQQESTNANTEYQFAPIPEFTPLAGAGAGAGSFGAQQLQAQSSQQQGLFHPSPQHGFMLANFNNNGNGNGFNNGGFNGFNNGGFTTSPRTSASLAHTLGYTGRRASSAQPMLMRSWTMPVPVSSYGYGMNGMGVGMGMIQRDDSPLPDVDPELFGDFSFGVGKSSTSTSSPLDSSALTSTSSDPTSSGSESNEPACGSVGGSGLVGGDESVDPTTSLAHIDTSVSMPEFSMHSASSSSSASSASTSGPGSPTSTSVSVAPSGHTNAQLSGTGNAAANAAGTGTGRMDSLDLSAYMHLEGLYAPEPIVGVGVGFDHHHHHEHGMYAPTEHGHEQYAMGTMGMGMYAYPVDPVVSTGNGEDGVYVHNEKAVVVVGGNEGGYAGGEGFYSVAA